MMERAVDMVRRCIAACVKPPALAIDATVGNGKDTAFLAELAGENGRVRGFDIQREALDSAGRHLREMNLSERVTLIRANHAEMEKHVPPTEFRGRIHAVMFNLGYLPGGNKSIVTLPETTLQALDSSLTLLAPDGILSIVAYTGHQGGKREVEAIDHWLGKLPRHHWKVFHAPRPEKCSHPPQCFLITGNKADDSILRTAAASLV